MYLKKGENVMNKKEVKDLLIELKNHCHNMQCIGCYFNENNNSCKFKIPPCFWTEKVINDFIESEE